MIVNIKNIIIFIVLIIIIIFLTKFNESFNPTIEKTDQNELDLPIHKDDNKNYDDYMIIGDGIEANISKDEPNEDKINICSECKTQKCEGLDCIECEKMCKKSTDIKSKLSAVELDEIDNIISDITAEEATELLNDITPEEAGDLLNSITSEEIELEKPSLTSLPAELSLPTELSLPKDIVQKQETKAKYALIPIKDFFRD